MSLKFTPYSLLAGCSGKQSRVGAVDIYTVKDWIHPHLKDPWPVFQLVWIYKSYGIHCQVTPASLFCLETH